MATTNCLTIHRPLKSLWRRRSNHYDDPCLLASSIPAEIILEIAERIVHPRDMLSFGLQSRRLLSLMLPLLYATIVLQSNSSIRTVFGLFITRPELARHVRELTLRPNYTRQGYANGGCLDESLLVDLVERLAADGNLEGLQSFVWEGFEGPKDRLWLSLRQACPSLNKIGSSLALKTLNPHSQLFNFSGLVSFSLVIHWVEFQPDNAHVEALPPALWKMLIVRCPGLQHLTIGGPSMPLSRIFDIRRLTTARWPRLRSLTLGDVKLQHDISTLSEDSSAFSLFLQAHPTLESLSLHRVGPYIPAGLGLPRSALPRLTFLCGTLYHVHDLPNPAQLRTLCLTSTHYTAFFLYDLLQCLTSLTSLSIWVDLSYVHNPSSGDHDKLFHTILVTCPGLLCLEILCSTHALSTFSYRGLTNALRACPARLQTLAITKLPHPSDSKHLAKAAADLALEIPSLRSITLRRATEQWSMPGKMLRLKEAGVFAVVKDTEGASVALVADEWRVGLFGRGRVARRHRYALPKSARG